MVIICEDFHSIVGIKNESHIQINSVSYNIYSKCFFFKRPSICTRIILGTFHSFVYTLFTKLKTK